KRKRRFARTPEPAGAREARDHAGGGRFVVQEHDATNLHWDLRLEHEGAALSWALPRGIPQRPERSANRLAVRTEDHPLEYLEFEGEIPAGEYGAGSMSIWDRGTYEAEKLREDEVIATFAGDRLRGRYALFRTGGKNWMIHRMDPPLDPEREPMPESLRPMQPVRGELPAAEGEWGFEVAWGGLRTLLWCEPGHVRRSLGRGAEDPVALFPELRRISRALGATEAILDGEVIVLGEGGVPRPQALRDRRRASSDSVARRLAREKPATLMLYDVPFLDGRSMIALPYEDRREALEALELEGAAWSTPSYHRGDGEALLAAAAERGLGGLLAKRLDSPYEPGRRSSAWVKVEA
ncbi:MAG TPA: DNA polymerase ligase N-terminal domain-containing protein, partial [Solirubrobacterales bacterium]|nr:DNA polymerase ligase N-terminal domain-containing protein [Solirubrobacterales bacterium]